MLSFMLGLIPPTDAILYITPYSKGNESVTNNALFIQHRPKINKLLTSDKSKFLYYINKLTIVYWLYSLLSIALDILIIIYKESPPGFFLLL